MIFSRMHARLMMAVLFGILVSPTAFPQSRPTRIAVLDFGPSGTALLASNAVREMFRVDVLDVKITDFTVVDADQTRSAARGAGFNGSLNMSLQESRDLGAAIGCDFYFIGEAQTLRRSSAIKPIYYESYASVFLVSARTGRLVLWERPSLEADTALASQQQFMTILSSAKTRDRYVNTVRQALELERGERASASENPPHVMEVLSDDESDAQKDTQAPRPYRRIKPTYPETASRAEIEATVDVLADIDAQGEIRHIEVARWAGYGLDEAVVNAVKQLHFFPAMRDGVAIPMRVLLRYNFRKPAKNSAQNRSR